MPGQGTSLIADTFAFYKVFNTVYIFITAKIAVNDHHVCRLADYHTPP